MIIISIPKSASSSLLETISVLHGLPSSQIDLKHLPVPGEFESLSHIHQDIVNLDEDTHSLFSRNDRLYKQHIPPTAHNLELFRSQKKVILIRRSVKDIILAYRRAVQKKIHNHFQDFLDCENESDWLNRADEIGLDQELRNFKTRWIEEGANYGNCHVVYYSDLLKNPNKAINSIERFWGFTISSDVALSKRRYSRTQGIQDFKAALGRKLVKIVIKVGIYKFLKNIQHLLRVSKFSYRW